jgi:hypothetical protein
MTNPYNMKIYFMKILKILNFHCTCLHFYQYTWSNFRKFDFNGTLYATYFGQEGYEVSINEANMVKN